MIEDRQTKLQNREFNRIDVAEEYNITKRLITIADIKDLINKVIDNSYTKDIKDKFDVDYIHRIKIEFEQPHNYDFVKVKDGPPSIKVNIDFYSWETKAEMYSRRSYNKRQLEEKKEKLEREAKQLGYKLEKVNE